jgi:hypothetical protein
MSSMQTILTSQIIDSRLAEAERRLADPSRAPRRQGRQVRIPTLPVRNGARRALGALRHA